MKIADKVYSHLPYQCWQIIDYLKKNGTGTVMEMQETLEMNDARKRISEINGQFSAGLYFLIVGNYEPNAKNNGRHKRYFLARRKGK